ncbi:MAG: lipid IV(A) 3-deoxy-D-manno-octulosonic acid transferase [Gammaproteobacteria bacterium]|nr:lipid IV(A) 3-deoxy-D-manno-octulosonic acid transferase [Gammaproteobacteria bacterium]
MRYLYTLCLVCFTPFFLLRLWWKGRTAPAYRQRILERFGLRFAEDKSEIDVWVHAVSLGEVNAVIPVIERLLARNLRVLLTTMTPTGSARVTHYFGQKVVHQYLPYDLPGAMRRFLRHYRPRVGVLMETELWPHLILTSKEAGVPLLLINGRLSQQSYQGYCWWRFWLKSLLNQFDEILVQTDDDAARFISLGADPSRVDVMGNVKFDIRLTQDGMGRFVALKDAWGKERVVLMLASTHDDEEKQILTHLPALQKAIPGVLVTIAPRHPDRFERVFQLCQSMGLTVAKGSQPELLNEAISVVVLDSLGELMQAYHAVDYAFVGGSLVGVGGHNVLEPIAVGLPVFSGPQVFNFKSICETLNAMGAIQLVASGEALIHAVTQLHADKTAKAQQIAQATQVLTVNRGVTDKYLERIDQVLA